MNRNYHFSIDVQEIRSDVFDLAKFTTSNGCKSSIFFFPVIPNNISNCTSMCVRAYRQVIVT